MDEWFFAARDGTQLCVKEMGAGRPLILLHGYCSNAQTNWIHYGHAARLADAGFHVIMPELRGHGGSDKPQDPAAYPRDILADDQFALIDHLALSDFDLGGYSLGGRTVARMLARGCRPRRAVIAGMGLQGLTDTAHRAAHFAAVLDHLGHHPKGSPAWLIEAFLKTTKGDPVALRHILSTFVDTDQAMLASFDIPIGVICGDEDDDNGSAEALAALLPHGDLITIAGNHMSAVTKPDLGEAIARFLTA